MTDHTIVANLGLQTETAVSEREANPRSRPHGAPPMPVALPGNADLKEERAHS